MGIEPLPIKPGSAAKAVPGYDVRILAEDGSPVAPEVEGAVAIKLPLPPGTLPTLWGDDERYVRSYLTTFPGYYLTGDGGHADEDGYLFVMGRIDDVINVAGHRLSTGSMEAVLATHFDVAECAVIGVADALKGQIPVGFVVLKAGVGRPEEEIERELVAMVREEIGALASLRRVLVVDRLPKTRSGKILRGTMRKIADDQEFHVPSTIDDPLILDEIRSALERRQQ
jgi:propionyl-CoA synthetase